MNVPDALFLALLAALALASALAFLFYRAWRSTASARDEIDHRARSRSTKYGQLSEAFAPWMAKWPLPDPNRFRFLGDPVDGVHFADDAVYLVEIKAAGARLSQTQLAVRKAVLEGRVGWVTFYVSDGKEPEVLRPWER